MLSDGTYSIDDTWSTGKKITYDSPAHNYCSTLDICSQLHIFGSDTASVKSLIGHLKVNKKKKNRKSSDGRFDDGVLYNILLRVPRQTRGRGRRAPCNLKACILYGP